MEFANENPQELPNDPFSFLETAHAIFTAEPEDKRQFQDGLLYQFCLRLKDHINEIPILANATPVERFLGSINSSILWYNEQASKIKSGGVQEAKEPKDSREQLEVFAAISTAIQDCIDTYGGFNTCSIFMFAFFNTYHLGKSGRFDKIHYPDGKVPEVPLLEEN